MPRDSDAITPISSPSAEPILKAGLGMFERNDALGAFDAVLAARAARTGIEALVSADTAFGDLAEISHVIPDHSGLSKLLKR
jgi:hypothetical protein